MEQVRLLLAIVLSFLVLVLWNTFFIEPEPPPAQDTQQLSKQNEKQPQEIPYEKDAETKTDTADSPYLTDTDISQPVRTARTITVSSPFYIVEISEKGAVFKSFVLKDYKESVEKDSPFKQMIPEIVREGSLQTEFADNSLHGLKDAVFSVNTDTDTLKIDKPEEITFVWKSPDNIVIEKTFRFSPSTYLVGLAVTVKNGSQRVLKDNLILSLTDSVHEVNGRYSFEGPSAFIDNQVEQIQTKKIKDKNLYTGNLIWTAIESRYFISAIIPEKPVESSMRLNLKPEHILESQYIHPISTIAPGTLQKVEFNLFFGPKSLKILNELNNGLAEAIDFGWFHFIAKPCLWLMNFLYSIIPNYGIAIIILTILIKLILWPLGNKGYQSMNEMKKLQPLMMEIREKYKDDKKKMNEEIMGLYRTYKVNPMGGCLPMILQIPVFFAFYRMLYQAIELRHAPFIGWINDLSAPDRLFHFNFAIPFMEPPAGIPVLTIIMGGTMFLQQKMSPPPGDPTQAKMMMFMPIIFTVIFINFSSGLVLYWLVNNILSISQQYYISKKK